MNSWKFEFYRRVLDDVSFAFEDHTDLYVAAVNCWDKRGDCYRDFGAGSKQGKGRLAANLQVSEGWRTTLNMVYKEETFLLEEGDF